MAFTSLLERGMLLLLLLWSTPPVNLVKKSSHNNCLLALPIPARPLSIHSKNPIYLQHTVLLFAALSPT